MKLNTKACFLWPKNQDFVQNSLDWYGLNCVCVCVFVYKKPFKDGQELLGRLESLLITRDNVHQRCNELQEEVHQQRGELQKVLQQHRMFRLGKTTQLSKLETELDQAFCDAQTWVPDKNQSPESELGSDQMLLNKDLCEIQLSLPSYRKGGGATLRQLH